MSTYQPPFENLPIFCDTVFPHKTTDTGNYVELSGNQTIDGVKNFVTPPTCSIQPSSANELSNKAYIDNVGANYVDISSTQIVGGNKTFSNGVSCGGIRVSGDINQSTGKFVNSGTTSGALGSGTFKNFYGTIWRMSGSSATSGTGAGYSPLLYSGDIMGQTTGWGCDIEGASFPSYTYNAVTIPAEGRDQWDIATGRWTCRINGNYLIQPSIYIRATNGDIRLYLALNRATGTYTNYIIKAEGGVIANETQVSYSNTLSLEVGDTISIVVYSTTGSYVRPYFEASSLSTTNLLHYTTLTINRIVG